MKKRIFVCFCVVLAMAGLVSCSSDTIKGAWIYSKEYVDQMNQMLEAAGSDTVFTQESGKAVFDGEGTVAMSSSGSDEVAEYPYEVNGDTVTMGEDGEDALILKITDEGLYAEEIDMVVFVKA